MKKTLTLFLAILAISSCSSTPKEMVSDSSFYEQYKSKNQANYVATCILDKWEKAQESIIKISLRKSNVKLTNSVNGYFVSLSSGSYIHYLADVKATPTGSEINIHKRNVFEISQPSKNTTNVISPSTLASTC